MAEDPEDDEAREVAELRAMFGSPNGVSLGTLHVFEKQCENQLVADAGRRTFVARDAPMDAKLAGGFIASAPRPI